MKNIFGTVRAKFVDGFFILLPVLLAYLMLGQLFDGLMALTQPIVDMMPASLFSDLWTHRFVAAMVLVILFVVVGLMANTPLSPSNRSLVRACVVLNRFPPYHSTEKFGEMDFREKCSRPVTSRASSGHPRDTNSCGYCRRAAGRRFDGLCSVGSDPWGRYASNCQCR